MWLADNRKTNQRKQKYNFLAQGGNNEVFVRNNGYPDCPRFPTHLTNSNWATWVTRTIYTARSTAFITSGEHIAGVVTIRWCLLRAARLIMSTTQCLHVTTGMHAGDVVAHLHVEGALLISPRKVMYSCKRLVWSWYLRSSDHSAKKPLSTS